MKRLNLILVSEDPETPVSTQAASAAETTTPSTFKDGDFTPEMVTEDMAASLQALDGALEMNPALANDPEIKALIAIKESMARSAEKNTTTPATTGDDKGNSTPPATEQKQTNTELAALPFFKEDGTKQVDFSKATVENLPTIAKEAFGVDTTKADWVSDLLTKVSGGAEAAKNYETVNTELTELKADFQNLPKEIKAAVVAFSNNQDWRTVIGNGATLDYSKDFKDLTPVEQVKAHNYYFPEDKLEETVDVKDKTVAKAISAASSKFTSDKLISATNAQRDTEKRNAETQQFVSSADSSIAQLKKSYPGYGQADLQKIDKIIKKDGIHTVFFDAKGNLLPDAAEKLAYALTGKQILQTAVAVAEGKGKSAGKADVLQTTQTKGAGGGGEGKQLTDEEKQLNDILKTSTLANQLTY